MSEKELKTQRSINRLWRFLNVLFFICFVWFAYDRDSGKHVFGYIFLAAAIISCIIRSRYQKMLNQLQDERDFKFSSGLYHN